MYYFTQQCEIIVIYKKPVCFYPTVIYSYLDFKNSLKYGTKFAAHIICLNLDIDCYDLPALEILNPNLVGRK